MSIVNLFTDGACQPNPGVGGWAFIYYPEEDTSNRVSGSGCCDNTTNNRMEALAVLEGIKHVLDNNPLVTTINLCSDSKYLINGIGIWMHQWVVNNWERKDKKPVLNQDLWKEIYAISKKVKLNLLHIAGHSGHPENEECDKLAVSAIKQKVA